MPILDVFIWLIVTGVLLYLVNTYIPMDDKIKKIFNFVVVAVVVIILISMFTGGCHYPFARHVTIAV